MSVLLILFGIVLIGCIIRYATEGTCSAYPAPRPDPATAPGKSMTEMNTEELQALLRKARTDVEIAKIKYQSALSNPYCWPATRDMVRYNLEQSIQYQLTVEAELDKRQQATAEGD